MSSSDARMFEQLEARVAALEAAHAAMLQRISLALGRVEPRDVSAELYGAEPDHGADREARAALLAKRRDRGA